MIPRIVALRELLKLPTWLTPVPGRKDEFTCICGKLVTVPTRQVKSGNNRSCGCRRTAVTVLRNLSHGQTGTRAYCIWASMLTRCTNSNSVGYQNYGGRGIRVCERWFKFENFLADMGHPPSGRTLDRIDPNGNYELSNCRWATDAEQSRNKRDNVVVEIRGERRVLSDWCVIAGIGISTARARYKKGWSWEAALFTPPNSRPRKDNKSGHTGVEQRRQRWLARISANGKLIHLGYYDTKEAAVAAYESAKQARRVA